MIKQFVKDTAQYFPALLIPAIISLFAIPIITRLFPPDTYGKYTLTIVTLSYLQAFSISAISLSIVRFFPIYQQKKETSKFKLNLIIQTLILSVLISALFLLVLSFLSPHISQDISYLMRVGILLFISTGFVSVLNTLLRSQFRAGWYTFSNIWISAVGTGLGLILVIIFHFGIDGLLWGTIIAAASAIAIIWGISIGKIKFEKSALSLKPAFEMAAYGFPLVPIGISSLLLSNCDRYIIQLFRGSFEVGVYSAGYTAAQSCIIPISALITLAAGPISIHLWETKGEGPTSEFLNRVTRYYLMLAIPAAMGLTVLCKPIIAILTGASYHESYRVVPWVAFGLLLLGLQQWFQSALMYHKKTKVALLYFIPTALLNIVLNFILVPIYGYMAAAITTLVCYIILLALGIIISRRFLIWEFPIKSLLRITVASLIMSGLVFGLSYAIKFSLLSLLLLVCLGVISYGVVLFFIRELQYSEINGLVELKARLNRKLGHRDSK